jgi:cytosine/adenosine deaminase-related metal-dependent hydrolase
MAIDPVQPWVLEGRVVTMHDAGVINDGAVYIRGGRIEAVARRSVKPPDGFAKAPRVRSGGTIFPGLIELHNHLSYNAMPLWQVPAQYKNNAQWRKSDGPYARLITKPTQVLGATPGVAEALIRFVEVRCLLGGVTTSQGITLVGNGGIRRFYRGLVRNVEAPLRDELPAAATRIDNPPAAGAQEYAARLAGETCLLQHLSEGRSDDETARGWFLRLQIDDTHWAIAPSLCGIHSAALRPEDFALLAEGGASMVWSPLSNYLLYGQSVDPRHIRNAGLTDRCALGSDWAPSGSKNLLGELKVAWLASREAGDVFSAEQLAAMVTRNPARICGWGEHLGAIAPGMLADLIVLDDRRGDPFRQLVEARESSVTLVVIDGVPRVGATAVMRRFAGTPEALRVGTARRLLHLVDADADPLVADIDFATAVERLRDGMERLPELAADLDAAGARGLLSGLVTGASADDVPPANVRRRRAPVAPTLRVVPDFEPEDAELDPALAFGIGGFADFVQPMHLDPPTVVDDTRFLSELVRARNLPEFVKLGLPRLYGRAIPLPPSAEFLSDDETVAPSVRQTTRELADLAQDAGNLSAEDRLVIVDEALRILEGHYVHLPLKRAMHAVDPVQRLRLLRYQIERDPDGTLVDERIFHAEMLGTFHSIRDLHTTYRLPKPWNGKVAWLPYLIEECWDRDGPRYLVTKVASRIRRAPFVDGVEVLHWNGTPIATFVDRLARDEPAGNAAARHARALNALTLRPLATSQIPAEEWVTLRYRDREGKVRELTQPWLVFEPEPGALAVDPRGGTLEAAGLGVDEHTGEIQEAKKALYAARAVAAEKQGAALATTADGLETTLPTVFRARVVDGPDGPVGYLRIFTFNVSDAEGFLDEFARLAGELPQEGLLIDVRGNGGGLIYAAEQLLQLLTAKRPIEPERAQFLNTTGNLAICRAHEESTAFPGLVLRPWLRSVEQAVLTGAVHSNAFPITDPAKANERKRVYKGPVVLIVDPLCYSATDMFAAGFQDHGIGPVLGVGANTGAGGANVWSHQLLRTLLDGTPLGNSYSPLPGGADLRVAVRRTLRVGPSAGDVLEDLGVEPSPIYRMTEDDLLHGNRDLIAAAAALLTEP